MKRLKLKTMNYVKTKVNRQLIDPKTYLPKVKIIPRKKKNHPQNRDTTNKKQNNCHMHERTRSNTMKKAERILIKTERAPVMVGALKEKIKKSIKEI